MDQYTTVTAVARVVEEATNLDVRTNTLTRVLVGILAFFLAYMVMYLIRTWGARRIEQLARHAERTRFFTYLADVVRATRHWVMVMLALWFALSAANVWPRQKFAFAGDDRYLRDIVMFVILLFQVAIWGTTFIETWVKDYRERRMAVDAAGVTTISVVAVFLKLVLYSIIFLMALTNLGIDIGPLIASLGIAGIAVGLAAQNVLGDLFASLSIVMDKPFVLGDFIIISSEHMGAVERIGMKTTRLRSLSGEQLVISNNDLLSTRIRNYKRMLERRVVFSFGVVYQTSYEKLIQIPEWVKSTVTSLEQTRFDRAHFFKYGESSLDFEVVYYVLNPDYNLYMDRQQAINLALFRKFEQEGVEFAYPTRTLLLEKPTSEEFFSGLAEFRK